MKEPGDPGVHLWFSRKTTMFTWICPQCGREVPPSYTECPTCAERRQQAAQPAAPPPPGATPPPPQGYAQPQYAPPQAPPTQGQPQYPPPAPPPTYAQPQYAAPPTYQQPQVYTLNEQKKGMPTWLVGLLTVVVLGGGLFGLYKFVGGSSKPAVKAVAPGDGKAHPYLKYLEVAGVRLMEGAGQKPVVRFTVVNHSEADLPGLELTLVLTPTTGGEPVAVIDAKVGTVPAQGIKEMESPLNTKLKVYELPDWQFVKTTFEITAPPK